MDYQCHAFSLEKVRNPTVVIISLRLVGQSKCMKHIMEINKPS